MKKDFKRCPRCDSKVPLYQDRCDNCGLIFSRLQNATNSAAKKAIKKKEYNKVITNTVLPKDVNKWKLLLLAIFLGWAGAHYAKVGRYKAFTFTLIAFAMISISVFLPPSWFYDRYLSLVMWALIFPASFAAIFWFVSIFQILFNKFKVPISIDEELVVENLDKEIVKSILTEVKSDKKSASKGVNSGKNEPENHSNIKKKKQKIRVVCASCGTFVKVDEGEKICPKCREPLNGD